ncbi:hypothetical protein HUT06_36550 [Actinomadura sp. NAK00032]|uniref:hypothetical protein n=1 Tax=Actinomadura sp. NAK00032 TaxID=2742128 RepID=UPI00158FB4B3|nr:hypothetical protein [Actinomadura sp. NAK00032]QKW38858.1 hypothetical protein HUT06_36550 [Actinomadura sp. NAK00032]
MLLADTVVGVLCGIAILAGGIVLLTVGRGEGRMSGAGFVVLAAGTLTGSLTTLILNVLQGTGRSFAAFSIHTILQLLCEAAGWTLLLLATNRLRRTTPTP